MVKQLLHAGRSPEHHLPERCEQQHRQPQSSSGQARRRGPNPASHGDDDKIEDQHTVAIPLDDRRHESVEDDDACAVRSEWRDAGRIGDFFEGVVAAAETGPRECQGLVPVVDLVVQQRPECRKRYAEPPLHQADHHERDAHHTQQCWGES
jgi:hypothetical protein